jgi:VCBS repeat-containing protein
MSSTATLNSATTAYTTTGEVTASGQYTAGGGELVKPNPSTSVASGVAIVDFADLSFTGVTITARGALIYNTSTSNAAVAALDFGADKTATSGTFTIQFPPFTTSAAILRIGNA